jgi:endonuclease/exonuclease/phosphatase family metal-dependent hydrolase
LLFDQIATAGYPDVVALQEVTRRFVDLLEQSHLCCTPAEVEEGGAGVRYQVLLEPGLGPLKPTVMALLVRGLPSCQPRVQTHHMPFAAPDDDMDRGVLACVLRAPSGWNKTSCGGGGSCVTSDDASSRCGSGDDRGIVVVVATTHLESPEPGNDNFTTRRRQCATALNFVEQLAAEVGACAAVVAGDFNATRADQEAAMVPHSRWKDTWLISTLAGERSPGYTFDCYANTHATAYQSRLDKVLLHIPPACSALGQVAVTSVVLVGTAVGESSGASEEPVDRNSTPPPPEIKLYASDHFGLHATFQMK